MGLFSCLFRPFSVLHILGYNYPLVRKCEVGGNSKGGQGRGVGNGSGKCEPNLLEASEFFTNV